MALHPGTDQVIRETERRERSGVTGGQVEAAKYVEFRNITTSFFTRYIGDFHEKHQRSAL